MGAQGGDPYTQGYGMAPNPYGGPNYGHPGMMGGGQMHGGGYGGMGGMGGGAGGKLPSPSVADSLG